MKCENCNNTSTTVIDSRPTKNNQIRRRRSCDKCNNRWTTYEVNSDFVTPNDKTYTKIKKIQTIINSLDEIKSNLNLTKENNTLKKLLSKISTSITHNSNTLQNSNALYFKQKIDKITNK